MASPAFVVSLLTKRGPLRVSGVPGDCSTVKIAETARITGRAESIAQGTDMELKEPVKAKRSVYYRAILEDADGVLHFWLRNGTYDGYCRPHGKRRRKPK